MITDLMMKYGNIDLSSNAGAMVITTKMANSFNSRSL